MYVVLYMYVCVVHKRHKNDEVSISYKMQQQLEHEKSIFIVNIKAHFQLKKKITFSFLACFFFYIVCMLLPFTQILQEVCVQVQLYICLLVMLMANKMPAPICILHFYLFIQKQTYHTVLFLFYSLSKTTAISIYYTMHTIK